MALLFVPLTVAHAQILPGGSCSTGSTNQSVKGGLDDLKNCAGNSIPDAGINSSGDVLALVAKVIQWALYISGAAAVLFVIYGGYVYMTAGGNAEAAGKGRQTVVNALIGLVIIILAYIIVNVVVNFILS